MSFARTSLSFRMPTARAVKLTTATTVQEGVTESGTDPDKTAAAPETTTETGRPFHPLNTLPEAA